MGSFLHAVHPHQVRALAVGESEDRLEVSMCEQARLVEGCQRAVNVHDREGSVVTSANEVSNDAGRSLVDRRTLLLGAATRR
jgi:hypothetical protein